MEPERYAVRISDAAFNDLKTAAEYHLTVAGLSSQNRFLELYDAAIDRLSIVPETAVRIGATPYYWIAVGNYALVYSIDTPHRIVKIHRLHYAASNWKNRIIGESNP